MAGPMAASNPIQDNGRYPASARAEHITANTRVPHTRPNRVLLPHEKALQVARRAEYRKEYNAELASVQADLDKAAQVLHEKNPRHTTDYYLNDIMHRSRMKDHNQVQNRWNAYISMRTRELNDGE